MKIILLKSNHSKSALSVCEVKDGYGKYLIRYGFAVLATPTALKELEAKKSEIELLEAKKKEIFLQIKKLISDYTFSIQKEASDTDILYGSITKKDVLDVINSYLLENHIQFTLSKNEISFDKIKSIGSYKIKIISLNDNIFYTNLDIVRI